MAEAAHIPGPTKNLPAKAKTLLGRMTPYSDIEITNTENMASVVTTGPPYCDEGASCDPCRGSDQMENIQAYLEVSESTSAQGNQK